MSLSTPSVPNALSPQSLGVGLNEAPWRHAYADALDGLCVRWTPAVVPQPRLLQLNEPLARELGLDPMQLASTEGVAVLAGNAVPPLAQPVAQAYAGHQFGGYSPRLGDGRALLLGELPDRQGRWRDVAFKGSGRTPFSRGGDGKAAVGPVLREYILGEAMHALGIPTTRALAAVATGERIRRDRAVPGAVLTRVAASHLRVGTFQYAAATGDLALLQRLAEYAIERHDPDWVGREGRFAALLERVCDRQVSLVAQWMGVGFIHGVMNTDNMTISGETIDYGPCAFLEAHDPQTAFSSIDTQGRYAYGQQPGIAQWNLARLAETLLPLIDPDLDRAVAWATGLIEEVPRRYRRQWLTVMRAKFGWGPASSGEDPDSADQALATRYLELLRVHRVDHTLGFRRLNDGADGQWLPLQRLFPREAQPELQRWLQAWHQRVGAMSPDTRTAMQRANPAYIARNHQVEAALEAAVERGDLAPTERLLAVLRSPHDEREGDEAFSLPAPAEQTATYQTFCGT